MRPKNTKNTREMPKGKTKCGQKGYDKGATILHPLVNCDVSQLTYLNIMLDANFCSLESHFPKTLLFPILQVNRMVVMLGCTPDLKGFLGFDSTNPPLLGQNLWFSHSRMNIQRPCSGWLSKDSFRMVVITLLSNPLNFFHIYLQICNIYIYADI